VQSVPDKQRSRSEQEEHEEILHIRHHSLFAPRDFDLSPYFEIVKPTLHSGFDPHTLTWAQTDTASKPHSKTYAS